MSKTTLAKLLAKENITVQYGNYQTAWFDIKDRVLGLPMWKDMGKDVHDLFIGHEVGHALFTPYEGWHDSPEKLDGCPRSYINVVEDARIERHIKDAYAGLVGPMARGYKKLFDDEFFGKLDDVNLEEIKLIDKINLKAKIGTHIEVPFNDEEIVFYNRAMTTKTFDDVLELVRDILAYTKENTPELLKPQPQEEQAQEQSDGEKKQEQDQNMGHDDMEPQDNEKQKNETPHNQDAEGNDTETDNKGPSEKNSDDGDSRGNVEDQKPADEDVSLTDEDFRRKEHTLIQRDERGDQISAGNEPRKEIRDKIVIPYKRLAADRIARSDLENYESHREEFKKYMKEIKKNTNYAVKEFEMRKAAYRYTRAQTAKTGSIDVNRLWSYKTNDDIFARVTQLADAKNHGMMMLIDYSGSMNNTMGQVMDQLLHLVTFCKTVNIPFDVYGFTSTNTDLGFDAWGSMSETFSGPTTRESEIDLSGLCLPQVVSSTLKKSDYEDAMFHIYLRYVLCQSDYGYSERSILSRYEDYGSTPLNQALVQSTRMIKEFRRKNNVDKMNLVILSDGDANSMNIARSREIKYADTDRYGKAVINIDNKKVHLPGRGRHGTKALLDYIRKQYGTQTIGFFIADGSYNYWSKISDAKADGEGYGMYDTDERKPYNREYSKHKCVTFKDTLGYNEFYVVKHGKNLDTDDDGFNIADDASNGQITSQFKKYSKSKKNNKTLLTNFGRVVA